MSAFQRGPIRVSVTRRPDREDGLVQVTCGADPETSGYRIAYRAGRVQNVIACLEACTKELWRLRAAGTEPAIQPERIQPERAKDETRERRERAR